MYPKKIWSHIDRHLTRKNIIQIIVQMSWSKNFNSKLDRKIILIFGKTRHPSPQNFNKLGDKITFLTQTLSFGENYFLSPIGFK